MPANSVNQIAAKKTTMNKHILIIDDEASIRDILGQLLTISGYRITAVASAAAAIESVRQDPPDLIISDLQLEDADGLEMIARLKVILPNVPVILLTGVLFDQEVVSDVLKTKVACYLAKTSSLTQILESVRRLLG
jgi:DNA-binding NtrC family response regulator